jgi:hypothetical protein
MAWLEGAIVKKVARFNSGGSKAATMARHDGVVEHIAVSNGLSLFAQFNTPGEPCSHFYVRKAGPQGEGAGMADFEQYVDTAYRAPANLEGNHRMISCETQGGVGTDLAHGWTTAQVNRLAWIAWRCHELHGFPLRAMHDSLPTSRGIGYHKLGINPWRVSGGETWSASNGKVCPGAARIAQIPLIISKAVAMADPTPTPPPTSKDWLDMATQAEVQAAVAAGVEIGIGNYMKRFFADGSGTGDAIWDDMREGNDAIVAAIQSLQTAVTAALTPKAPS